MNDTDKSLSDKPTNEQSFFIASVFWINIQPGSSSVEDVTAGAGIDSSTFWHPDCR